MNNTIKIPLITIINDEQDHGFNEFITQKKRVVSDGSEEPTGKCLFNLKDLLVALNFKNAGEQYYLWLHVCLSPTKSTLPEATMRQLRSMSPHP